MTPPSSTGAFPLLSFLIFAPLAAALVAGAMSKERVLRWWALAASTAIAAVSLLLFTRFQTGTAAFQFTEHAVWIPRFGIAYSLGVDGIAMPLVLLTTLFAPLCVLCSWSCVRTRLKEFVVCLFAMESAMVGVFSALDFVLFFVFWEAMLVPMAVMIGVWGGPRRVYASIKFFIYTMAGSVFLLVAGIAIYLQAGSFDIREMMGQPFSPRFQVWVFLAFFAAFAIKVPMFPFHTWLPAAHVEAPTAGSVILAAILLKMGTYGFLRFSLPVTPWAAVNLAPGVLWLSVAAILYGGFAALAQSDLKKLVAYSSVGHMGFATLGIFTLVPAGLSGAALVGINHGVTTGALFIAVGIVYERLHTRDLGQAAGLGKHMPVFAGFLGVFCLSSMAFPGTNSFIGEWLVLSGGFSVSKTILLCVVPGVVAAAAYNLRMLQRVAYGGTANPGHAGVRDLGLREIAALAVPLVFVFWIGLHPGPLLEVMDASLQHVLEQVHAGASMAAAAP
jgi:NADH-quinone oxidoreductase subunit M